MKRGITACISCRAAVSEAIHLPVSEPGAFHAGRLRQLRYARVRRKPRLGRTRREADGLRVHLVEFNAVLQAFGGVFEPVGVSLAAREASVGQGVAKAGQHITGSAANL